MKTKSLPPHHSLPSVTSLINDLISGVETTESSAQSLVLQLTALLISRDEISASVVVKASGLKAPTVSELVGTWVLMLRVSLLTSSVILKAIDAELIVTPFGMLTPWKRRAT